MKSEVYDGLVSGVCGIILREILDAKLIRPLFWNFIRSFRNCVDFDLVWEKNLNLFFKFFFSIF